jgi:methyl-accepting chemotaxis protein
MIKKQHLQTKGLMKTLQRLSRLSNGVYVVVIFIIALMTFLGIQLSNSSLSSIGNAEISNIFLVSGIGVIIIIVGLRLFNFLTIERQFDKIVTGLKILSAGNLITDDIQLDTSNHIFQQSFQNLLQLNLIFENLIRLCECIPSGQFKNTSIDLPDDSQIKQALCNLLQQYQKNNQQIIKSLSHLSNELNELDSRISAPYQLSMQISDIVKNSEVEIDNRSKELDTTKQQILQVTRAIDGIAAGAQEQTNAVDRMSVAVAQMSDVIQQVNEFSQKSSTVSDENHKTAIEGVQTLQQSIEALGKISDAITEMNQKVNQMTDLSEKIGKIIGLIKNITDETHLLSLNAAIEAARAGIDSKNLAEKILDQHMVGEAKLIAELFRDRVDQYTVEKVADLARLTGLDTITLTDQNAVVVLSEDKNRIGWQFPSDPKSQTYPFLRLISESNGVVTQPSKKRVVDDRIIKLVGVSRRDKPGIVQVGVFAENLQQFQMHGDSFAVVVQEIRKLSQNSGEATKEIAGIIHQIQLATEKLVNAMQSTFTLVNIGSQRASQASQSLENIKQMAERVKEQIEQILNATSSMNKVNSDLVNAMEEVSAVVEQNTASVEEIAASNSEIGLTIEKVFNNEEQQTTRSIETQMASLNDLLKASIILCNQITNETIDLQKNMTAFLS